MVAAYLQPDTADNQPLRQCLSYFFPVYCYSSSANQRTMQKVFCLPVASLGTCLTEWFTGVLGLVQTPVRSIPRQGRRSGDDSSRTVRSTVAGLDGPNESRVSYMRSISDNSLTKFASEIPGQDRDETIHVDAACDIIRTLFEKEMDSESSASCLCSDKY